MRKHYIVDGNLIVCNYAHMTNLTCYSKDGKQEVYPASQTLKYLMGLKKHGSVTVVFDPGKRNTFRSKIFPEYKQDRDKNKNETFLKFRKRANSNLKLVQKYATILGINTLRLDGYEGDDLAYLLSKEISKNGNEDPVIVTNDSDYFQVLDEIKLFKPVDEVYYTSQEFKESYGFEPSFYKIFLSITGTHNNVKGVQGLGKVRVTEIIKKLEKPTYGSLIKWAKSGEKYGDLILENKDIIKRNLRLIDFHRIPLTEQPILDYINLGKKKTTIQEKMELKKLNLPIR